MLLGHIVLMFPLTPLGSSILLVCPGVNSFEECWSKFSRVALLGTSLLPSHDWIGVMDLEVASLCHLKGNIP